MAGGSARKRAEENAARLNLLKAFVLVGAGTFIAARLLLFKGSTTLAHWLGFAATLLLDALAYGSIAFAARPTYDGAGNLIDGGANLNKGIISNTHDLLYITTLVQVVAAFTKWGWYIYLLLPAYGLYLLVTKVLVPAWTAPDASDTPLDPALLKKMQRTEQRAERRARKRF